MQILFCVAQNKVENRVFAEVNSQYVWTELEETLVFCCFFFFKYIFAHIHEMTQGKGTCYQA